MEANKSDNDKKKENSLKWLNMVTSKNGYDVTQSNGQRIYSPGFWLKVPTPPKGCEIFIGKLPKYCFEDELIPLLSQVGPLYNFRLMLDFSDLNRGYAFAKYFSAEHADRAVEKFNNYELYPKLHIGVFKSLDNCRLFVGNIPTELPANEIEEELKTCLEGLERIFLYNDKEDSAKNRGFLFAEFKNHRCAAMARRQFKPDNLVLWDRPLYVDWADPIPEVDEKVMASVTVIYAKNLPLSVTSLSLKCMLSQFVNSSDIQKIHKTNHYAFIHFFDRQTAENALKIFQTLDIQMEGKQFEFEWARPQQYSKKHRLEKPLPHFCRSVPPNVRRLNRQRLCSDESINTDSIES